jgi:hypothetical protein
MMKACAEVTRPRAIKTTVSVNPIMVDGTGMCGGCRIKVGDQVKFACVDGPDFDGHLVDFDDLMTRLNRYKTEERAAEERFSATCRMTSDGALEALAVLAAAASKDDQPDAEDPFEQTLGG